MKTYPMFLLAILALLAPLPSAAQLPPMAVEFDFEGFGNAVMNSPVVYSGDILFGDPLVVGSTWTVTIDDSAWPPVTDPQARWDYVFNTYFVYQGSPVNSWTAVFDETNLPAKPAWRIVHPTNGLMGGTLIVVITYSDWNCDGVLDLDERMQGVYSGNLVVMKYGTGAFAGYCGEGTFNGGIMNPDPGNWADDYIEGHGLLQLLDCRIGVETASWGDMKGMYR